MSKPSEAPTPVTTEDLCVLANSFVEQARYDQAIRLYESACRLFPDDLALRIHLGRVRNLKNQALEPPADMTLPSAPVSPASKDVWANRYQGLGEIFLKTNRRSEAKQVFEMSKVSNPNFFLPYYHLGRLCLEEKKIGPAVRELEQGRHLNPFHEETTALLAEAYLEQREYRQALECWIDAMILSGEASGRQGSYRAKIKEVMPRLPDFTPKMRNDLIRERRNRIHSLYEELEAELKKVLPEPCEEKPGNGSTHEKVVEAVVRTQEAEREEKRRVYDIAVQMKRHLVFRNMEDEDVFKIAHFSSEMRVLQGDFVYQEGDPVYGLYLISRGKVEIRKTTPYGPVTFSTFEKESFFGDDVLLSDRERVVSALAVEESDLLFIDKAGLASLFSREKAIAIHFLWYFWKSLSLQIQESNDQLSRCDAGRRAEFETRPKVEVLAAKRLSSKELGQISRLGSEKVYNRGEIIFREGDPGDRLYIVLEGSVLIGKATSALVEKGDFFGEMALVGQHHVRSADARAREPRTRLLVLRREVVREILSVDTHTAYTFLTILCRMLSQRLLEINEKICQWKIRSGPSV